MSALPPSDASSAVPSPCMGICRMDAANRWCVGCLRSLDEIAAWSQMAAPERHALWAQLAQRRAHQPSRQMAATPDT